MQKINSINYYCWLSKVHTSFAHRKYSAKIGVTSYGNKKIVAHFGLKNQKSILELFPLELKKIKNSKSPKAIYVASDIAANTIADAITPFYNKNVPFVELDPGPCILTKKLLEQMNLKQLRLFESREGFKLNQMKFITKRNLKIPLKYVNWTSLYRTDVLDSILDSLQTNPWHENINAQIFLCLSTTDVISQLAKSVIMQNGLFSKGRMEFFAILPAYEYTILTCGPEVDYLLYKYKSCIFQILFEYEYLAKIERTEFLPWWTQHNRFKNREMPFAHKTIEDGYFYLMRFTPRSNLLSLCDAHQLPELAFFVNQCFFKRKAWIIPKLEKWIPGIGVKLITHNEPSTQVEPINLNVNLESLPPNTQPCTTMRIDDFFTNINIFTECGSLTPSQTLSLFHIFRNSPEYEKSEFHQHVKAFFQRANVKESDNILDSSLVKQ